MKLRTLMWAGVFMIGACGGISLAAEQTPQAPVNSGANPYKAEPNFFKMPSGRTMGSTSGVAVDRRGHIWIAERCGANTCADSKLDPIMEFDEKGNFVKAFGGGLTVFPHGLFIDRNDHIWLADAFTENGKGYDVLEFDRDGKLLRKLGKPSTPGGPDTLTEPNAVFVAPNGDIFVAEGHTEFKGKTRIVKFDRSGKFLMEWGDHGDAPGQLETPHTIAMDSAGLLYVGDRWNNRIQVFDQKGKLIKIWTQFGRPSGLYIDKNDILYSTDSESRNPRGYGYHPGWKRGIRIGSVKDGVVTAFIPDADPDPDANATSGGEGIWVDDNGVIYSAQVKEKSVKRFVKK